MAGLTPPPSNRRVRSLLRDEAERHQPDVDRIRSRFDPAMSASPGTRGRRWRRTGAPLVSAVAAGVVALAAVAGAQLLREPGEPDARPAALPSAVTGSPAPAGTIGPAAPTAGSVLPTSTRTPPAATTPPRSPAGSATRSPSALPRLELRQLAAGHRLAFGPGTGVDWLLPGVRADGTIVRRSDPRVRIREPVLDPGRSGAAGAPGPYATSWTGGAPERERASAPGWLAVDPDGGTVRFEVPATGVRRQLLVYLGTDGADCTVRAGVPGRTATVTLNAPAVAAVATVTVEAGSGPVVVELVGASRSGAGRFGVAAVELR